MWNERQIYIAAVNGPVGMPIKRLVEPIAQLPTAFTLDMQAPQIVSQNDTEQLTLVVRF